MSIEYIYIFNYLINWVGGVVALRFHRMVGGCPRLFDVKVQFQSQMTLALRPNMGESFSPKYTMFMHVVANC
jgi:hypothetical protein